MIKLTRQQSIELYKDVTERNDFKSMRILALTDLFYLLLIVFKRYDLNNDWLYDRIREVESNPDGYLDLWAREHYKALACDTPVLTNNGWKNHIDLKSGDMIFSPSGDQVKVIANTGILKGSVCYNVGDIICSGEHLWPVQIKRRFRNGTKSRIISYETEILETKDCQSIRLQNIHPIKIPSSVTKIDPYVLGVWLGDGHSSCGRITCGDDEIWDLLKWNDGYSDTGTITKNLYNLMPLLRSIGVLNNKHIPKDYLLNGENERLALLQGLMDTDGHCSKRGTATFVNTNGDLIDGVFFLATSLGFNPSRYDYDGFSQVSFQAYSDICPFRLSRKVERCKNGSRRMRTFYPIKKVESVDVNCIQVEGNLYLAGKDLIPTHNSTIITYGKTIQDILNNPEITVGIFSHTSPIAKAFLSQIKRELETNTMLQDLFPDILYKNPQKESPKWSTDAGIIVKRKSNPKESTVEAHGLVDGQPTSRHFNLMIYDDVVTKESVSTPEMIAKVTEAFSLSLNLAGKDSRKRYIGTRYHCLVSKTRILMSDWTHKNISEVKVGDEVIGWELVDSRGTNKYRLLRKSIVKDIGKYENQEVKEFKFDCGRSVISTADHKWWRGPNGSGSEYKELGLNYHKMKSVRRLLDPVEIDNSREAGWLSGFFDGEGSYRKNTYHPSGTINITQTMLNPSLIDKVRELLEFFDFDWSESWNRNIVSVLGNKNFDKCMFNIKGGWKERYRFLMQIYPHKRKVIENTLFGQMLTDKVNVIEIIDRPNEDVYWIETETGNYIAEGFCSKNSNDTYKTILDRGTAIPRVYPATDDGTVKGKPVLLTQAQLDEKLRDLGSYIFASQMLLNPTADKAQGFKKEWLMFYDILRNSSKWNYFITVDPASEKKKTNDYTVITVIGLAPDKNYYLVEGIRDRINLTERTRLLFNLVRKWNPLAVGYERYGMQSDIEHIKYVQEQEGFRFQVIELGGNIPKPDRIRRLVPLFEQHRFYIPRRFIFVDSTGKARDFIQELINDEYDSFPVCTHDDMLDCISRIVDEDLGAVFPTKEEDLPLSITGKQKTYDPLSLENNVNGGIDYAPVKDSTSPWRQKAVIVG